MKWQIRGIGVLGVLGALFGCASGSGLWVSTTSLVR